MDSAVAFWARVDRPTDDTECWRWRGQVRRGYGRLWADRRRQLAHRFAYALLVGPIPGGLTLDHLCRNKVCVNPAHLEPATDRENILRGTSPSAINARKTHCIHGHPFTPENTYVPPNGDRKCRACRAGDSRPNSRRRHRDIATPEAPAGDEERRG